ncbi:MAG: ATP synthase F1 subunit gamma [Anaerolineae bacterium]
MATLREIRRRIRSVRNISQVTRAMQMVAAAKMQRAQERTRATRPYAEKAWALLVHLASQRMGKGPLHPLLQERPVQTVGMLLITADKGLCGGYNHNILHEAHDFIDRSPYPVRLVVVGRRGCDYMARAGMKILASFTNMPSQPSLMDVTPISCILLEEFLSGAVDQVVIAYTRFVNTLVQRPAIRHLLPIRYALAAREAEVEARLAEYIYEPDPRTILETVVPRFTEIQVYQAVLESTASEHSARMVAMRNATENAEELMDALTLAYHRARQATITREMLDIASGAEALKRARQV